MQTCPKCKQIIEDDSWFCDQCGTELMVCPKCNAIRRGIRCNTCGTKLVTAKDFAQSGGAMGGNTTPPVVNQQPSRASLPRPDHLVCYAPHIRLGVGNGAVIGRRGDYAQVFAGQGYVSGRHACLQFNARGELEVVDLGSTNGTFVNGVQLAPNVPKVICIGDSIKFANLEFKAEP